MKAIFSGLLLFLSVTCIAAQAAAVPNRPDSLDVEILKSQWYMEVNNPAFEKSPFGAIEELQQNNRVRKETRRQNEIRARRGLPPQRTQSPPPPLPQAETGSGKSPNIYTYKVKIKNTGAKVIEKMNWDYIFFEPGTEKEVGRILFESERVNLGPGKTKQLSISTVYPPANTINVNNTGRKFRDQYSTQIVIQSIEYTDGTLWEAASKAPE
jgi:hypothetical protein